MALSEDYARQLVKAIKSEPTKPTESTVYGTVSIIDGKPFVMIDGSGTQYTPVTSTIVVKNGDRVVVTNKDHSYIVTGNLTDPSTNQTSIDKATENINTRIDEFDIILADKVSTEQLNAVNANIQNLQATNVTIAGKLEAAEGKIDDLETDNLKVNDTLEAHAGKFDTIDATFVNISGELNANKAKFETLEATDADFRNLEADYGDFKNLTADNFEATNATIENLKAKDAEFDTVKSDYAEFKKVTAEDLKAVNGEITNLKGKDAEFETITADYAKFKETTTGLLNANDAIIKNLNNEYANIDFVNIGEAAIEKVFADSGMFKDFKMEDGVVTGELTTVTLRGDRIVGGSIQADKLVLKNSTDGLYYALNVNSEGFAEIGESYTEEELNNGLLGTVIIAKSVTADKIDVSDLSAFKATIGGFIIDSDKIHSAVKDSVDNGTRGIYMDNDGQVAFGDGINRLKYYRDEDGEYKLDITASSMRFASPSDLANFNATIGGFNITNSSLYSGEKSTLNNPDEGIFMDRTGQIAIGDDVNHLKYYKDEAGKAHLDITATSMKFASPTDLADFNATIGRFKIVDDKENDRGVIYSGDKESVDKSEEGIYMDSAGQFALGDDENYLKYYRDADGNKRLDISAASVKFSSSGKTVEEVIEETADEAGNIQVGAKNLIRNSNNLIFDDYGFEEAYLNVSYDSEGNVVVDSNAIAADEDGSGNAEIESGILTPYADDNGNASLFSEYDIDDYIEADMNTLTIGGYKFNIVSGATKDEFDQTIGSLDELYTEDKSSVVAAINEVYLRGGTGGGGGGGSLTFTITLTNLSDSRVITVPDGKTVIVKMNYTSIDADGIDDGPGVGTLLVGGTIRRTVSVNQGDFEVDVTPYLSTGINNISVKVTNSENITKTMTYTVTVASVSLTSSFDASRPYSGSFSFPYTPTGLAAKTVHFELDGKEIGTATVNTSGRQVSYSIPAQSHGAHVLRVWFTCNIEGTDITSNVLYYNIICVVAGNDTPIIAVSTPPTNSVEQYTNIVTKYRVYSSSNLTSAITLEVNGTVVSSLTVDRTEQTWSYQPTEIGSLTQTIRCGDEYVSWTQTVTESSIEVEAETEALALHLSSYGRSNNESNPNMWESNGIVAEFSNFNFVSDGWVQDDDNITVLRVTGDARLTIPYKIFAYDFRTTGKTLEFELATREVLDYDAEVLTCLSNNRGFVITAQQLQMTSQQSTLGSRYKEDEHIRVSIVAEKKTENRLLLCYINGILSGAVQYPDDDDFSQSNPVGITVGSNECTVDLYNIRAYDNSLTRHQILDNWIADTQIAEKKLARYKRNEVYDAYGQVVISQLPSDLPYMVLQATELPQFKGDKKTLNGYYTDPLHPERSFTIVDAQIDVQGTSSQYYYVKNYKIKYKNGFVLYDGSRATTYQMNSNAVPTNEFTMKADVASSEGAFNVVLAMLYDELCPYKTPAQEANSKVRQCIEGFPIVMFWDNGAEIKFLGKYNFNNDKGTPEVFGFKPGDESWEIRQNGTDRVGWHSADFSGDDWKNDFEARYPEDNANTTRLKALAEWLMSTDTDQATGNAIAPVTYNGVTYNTDSADYRLAKFSAELSSHFIEDAIIFYYLFTEIFLSIDQREKNAFPTYLVDEDRWIVLFYDADSSCGTDNKGNLTFDYYLEDIDYTEGGDPVYNGQNSVLWKNLRETRRNEIAAMYKDLRTRTENSISYESVITAFENHQSKWPEAIFNEDMYRKCLEPLILKGDGLYLPMLQGKKEMWMKWWLYNRFRYLDSKYETGTSMTNRITIRTHAKANVSLTSYTNMYGRVYYNAEMVEHRMERGQEYEFVWTATGAEDAVIGVNDADMLTSLGDLSSLMVELIDVSGATHLTSLKIGDVSPTYKNYSLNSVTLGNNILLRKLDLRNCVNLEAGPDLSGCTNIEEVYCGGSSITGIQLPNGGVLKFLHLPSTITNLTVRNQKKLKTFIMPSYTNISTLWLENNSNVIDPFAIFNDISETSRVRLIGFDKEMTTDELFAFINRLDTMRGVDENGNTVELAQVYGTIHVDVISKAYLRRITEAQVRYPGLKVVYNTLIPYFVHFYNYDGTLLQRVIVHTEGAAAAYTGETPTKPNASIMEVWQFDGWDPDPVSVVDDMYCYARFRNTVQMSRVLMTKRMVGSYRNDKVTRIGGWGLAGNNLTSIEFPNVTVLWGQSIASLHYLTYAYFPNVEHMHVNVTYNMYLLQILDLPKVQRVDDYSFGQCSMLKALVMRSTSIVRLGNSCFGGTPIEAGDGYVYVPASLIESYKSATNWSEFADQFRALEEYTVDGTITGEIDINRI